MVTWVCDFLSLLLLLSYCSEQHYLISAYCWKPGSCWQLIITGYYPIISCTPCFSPAGIDTMFLFLKISDEVSFKNAITNVLIWNFMNMSYLPPLTASYSSSLYLLETTAFSSPEMINCLNRMLFCSVLLTVSTIFCTFWQVFKRASIWVLHVQIDPINI